MKRLLAIGLVSIAAACLLAAPVMAGSDTQNLNVSATVTNGCTVDTSDGAPFGNYVSNQAAGIENGIAVAVNCGSSTTFTLFFGQGSYWSASVGWRMGGTGDFLDFDIKEGACPAGETSLNTTTDYGTTAATYTLNGCAVLPGLQTVATGGYSESIPVTVTY